MIAYPARFTPEKDAINVVFPDLPEAITVGDHLKTYILGRQPMAGSGSATHLRIGIGGNGLIHALCRPQIEQR